MGCSCLVVRFSRPSLRQAWQCAFGQIGLGDRRCFYSRGFRLDLFGNNRLRHYRLGNWHRFAFAALFLGLNFGGLACCQFSLPARFLLAYGDLLFVYLPRCNFCRLRLWRTGGRYRLQGNSGWLLRHVYYWPSCFWNRHRFRHRRSWRNHAFLAHFNLNGARPAGAVRLLDLGSFATGQCNSGFRATAPMRTTQVLQQMRLVLFRYVIRFLLFADSGRLQLFQQQPNRQAKLASKLRYIHFRHYHPLTTILKTDNPLGVGRALIRDLAAIFWQSSRMAMQS
jgi:hypothetical protein